jgi:hypothetical protein
MTTPKTAEEWAMGYYFIQEKKQHNDLSIWIVGCDVDSHVADFTGSKAEKNAREYASWKNSQLKVS